jgi:hypothetical protein
MPARGGIGLDPDAEYIEAEVDRSAKTKNGGEDGQAVFSPSWFSVIRK